MIAFDGIEVFLLISVDGVDGEKMLKAVVRWTDDDWMGDSIVRF